MNLKWKDIENAMRRTQARTVSRDPSAFWSEFKMRAPMYGQADSTTPVVFMSPMRWGVAAACLLAVTTLTFVGVSLKMPKTEYNSIRSLDVSGNYSALFIMEDDVSKATVLWIDGLKDT